jgi:hypothetical protein
MREVLHDAIESEVIGLYNDRSRCQRLQGRHTEPFVKRAINDHIGAAVLGADLSGGKTGLNGVPHSRRNHGTNKSISRPRA